jgi:hypothetical protein
VIDLNCQSSEIIKKLKLLLKFYKQMIDAHYTYGSPSKTAAIMGGSPMRTIAERACAISGSPISSPLKQPRHGEAHGAANDY